MNIVLVAVVVVLGVVTGYLASQARRRASDIGDVNAEVRVDTEGLVAAVKEAVDARVGKAAQEALKSNTELANQLIDERSRTLEEQTKNLLQPVTEQMHQLKASVGDLKSTYEKNRGSVDSLNESLTQQINELTSHTGALAGALKSSSARGAWGENQLRNIIDLSGMASYCDFSEQTTAASDDGALRPDLTVRLPNGAFLVVDSKVPLASYLRMQEIDDSAAREAELKGHVKAMQKHVKALSDKRYWELFDDAPDFVVMFVPGESFLADALRAEPGLVDEAMRQRVVIASPMSLMALLLTIARGWQTTLLADNAKKVEEHGRELHRRVGTTLTAMAKTGRGLETATKAYNEMVGSVESRVLPTLRRFSELGVSGEELPEVKPVETSARDMTSRELESGPDAAD
ncbi:MAG: DNA recombination protein RmuC [Acidimicrobiales bacterium]|nr:DNA recombination protein RmuC [Acidimicrobiales bacterium]MEC8921096.1 DNA recombination protein RmuC [Actinomycetota bacterium]|tara:strand:- start:1527 stop:2735 length:1209 start_codon:yes stop_codon:yes gene_type:complete